MLKRTVTLLISVLTLLAGVMPALKPQDDDGRISLPIVMYHSVCNIGVGDYVVSPKLLEDDFAFLKERGYAAVFVNEVVDFVEKGGSLPEKPIVITFDDGFYNNCEYVLPLLKKYGFKAVVNIVGSFSERESGAKKRSRSYSYLKDTEIAEMSKSGLVETGNHSYAMHSVKGRRGVSKKSGESDSEYEKIFTEDCVRCADFIKSACGVETKVFAYPFGSYSKSTPKLLKALGYKAALTCAEGVNRLKKGDTGRLMWLKRVNRSARLTRECCFERLGIR